MCGVAVSLPGSPGGAIIFFWCLVLTVQAAWFLVGLIRSAPRDSRGLQSMEAEATDATPSGQTAGETAPFLPVLATEANLSEGASSEVLTPIESQRISRYQDGADGEVVAGLLRCTFAPGERQRDIHLAFCPPLKRIPQFSAEQVEGPPARIRPSLVETFGAGLEVRLAALSSEPTSVQIQFFASESPVVDDAG